MWCRVGYSPRIPHCRYAALNNCAFVSTERLKDGVARPFCFLMDASMLGVGVGFDTKVRNLSPPRHACSFVLHGTHDVLHQGAGSVVVKGPSESRGLAPYVVADTREGWVDSVRVLLEAWLDNRREPPFDYSVIRPAGSPIRGFGGVCSGAASLESLHDVRGCCVAPAPTVLRAHRG